MNILKLQSFEYILNKLIEWNKEVNNTDLNDISILKSLKLLFFISAVNTNKDSKDTLLDSVFTNYVAMPYGHVESDIYNAIKNGDLQFFRLTTHNCTIKDNVQLDFTLNQEITKKIDSSVEALKLENINLINLNSFDLVELSHNWYSWKYFFSIAKRSGTNSIEIPIEVIKSEEKIFSF